MNGRFLSRLETYETGKSDKFQGTKYTPKF